MAKKPTKPVDKRQSLAALWDDTDPSEASNMLSSGEHTVRLNKIEVKEDVKKGTAVFCEYESIEGEEEGKTVRQMYKLTDASGAKAQGLAFLMRDLGLLGYEDIKGSKLKKTLAEITEEQPMVVINVKENGVYVNAYLVGLADDDSDDDADDEDDDSEDEDEEKPKKKTAKKKPSKDEDEDEDEDGEEEEEEAEDEDEEEDEEEEAEDEDEEDEDEEEEEEDEDGEEEEAEDEDEEEEEEDEDEDEDEDEEEKPKKKKKK